MWNLKICILVMTVQFATSNDNVIIQTNLGQIKGIRDTVAAFNQTVFKFYKIPFANAPVGQLRFERPQAFGSWNGTLDATIPGPSCFQIQGEETNILQNKNTSEDCLYLDIYVPNNLSPSNNKTVMIWVHGGGYVVGQAALYDGSYIAAVGDVIVVSVQYRLGVFGFFSKHTIAGNQGLRDQIMAIKWVKDNIASFGGNPESVTIFGESAGGFSVGLLSIISQNRGLFKRAILQSGCAIATYALVPSNAVSESVARYLNCNQTDPSTSISCLKNAKANDLLTASLSFMQRPSYFHVPYGPTIDGDLLKDQPSSLLANKDSEEYKFFKSLDIVVGTVSGESSVFMSELLYGNIKGMKFNASDGIPLKFLCDIVAPDLTSVAYNNDRRISDAICKFYEDKTDYITQSLNILSAFTDFVFTIPAVQSLNIHSSGGNYNTKQYHYMFSRHSPFTLVPGFPSWFDRAQHASDIVFQFPNFLGQKLSNFSSNDYDLAVDVMKYWTHFAKFGNMNVTGLPLWREYDSTERHYVNFDVPITPGQHLYKARVKFWLTDIPAILDTTSLGVKWNCRFETLLSLTVFLLII